MLATIKVGEKDRAYVDPTQASRPFSLDRKGFVLAEGAGVLLLAAEEKIKQCGLTRKAEVVGIGMTSDAKHFTRPNKDTIVRAIRDSLTDAEISAQDIGSINAHGTSTPTGDATEVECLREVFAEHISNIPVSANKSQVGHSLGASAAIEAALSIEAMSQGVVLPTVTPAVYAFPCNFQRSFAYPQRKQMKTTSTQQSVFTGIRRRHAPDISRYRLFSFPVTPYSKGKGKGIMPATDHLTQRNTNEKSNQPAGSKSLLCSNIHHQCLCSYSQVYG